eukprot:gene25535-11180_t
MTYLKTYLKKTYLKKTYLKKTYLKKTYLKKTYLKKTYLKKLKNSTDVKCGSDLVVKTQKKLTYV